MKTFSINRTASVGISMLVLVALFALVLPMSASAQFAGTTSGDANRGGRSGQSQNENQPYSVSGIRSCVTTHLPSGTGSSTSETITKAKGDALVSCIKNARQRTMNNTTIEELLRKIEGLRMQIQALKKRSGGATGF